MTLHLVPDVQLPKRSEWERQARLLCSFDLLEQRALLELNSAHSKHPRGAHLGLSSDLPFCASPRLRGLSLEPGGAGGYGKHSCLLGGPWRRSPLPSTRSASRPRIQPLARKETCRICHREGRGRCGSTNFRFSNDLRSRAWM